MLKIASLLKGYTIEASDGRIGSVTDILFDDNKWTVRWLVVEAGTWLTGRKVLIHPSAVAQPDHGRRELPVNLTRAQVKASPDVFRDQPVSRQMERELYGYYGWDPLWGGSLFGMGANAIATPLVSRPLFGGTTLLEPPGLPPAHADGDPHLRSMAAVDGYHIDATDGVIGHLEDLMIDDAAWDIRYLVINTRNWWIGNHVLMSPYSVKDIDWGTNRIRLDVSREKVKTSPPYSPATATRNDYERRLHTYYGWPGYGW
jgi:sporulation protein YlmC with PRC-barrel domain